MGRGAQVGQPAFRSYWKNTAPSALRFSRRWCASRIGAQAAPKSRPVMTIFDHVLAGCAPVPLGSYLKALGIFRLVAEQADGAAKGFWRNERFVMQSVLNEARLFAFFCERYEPSPIISP